MRQAVGLGTADRLPCHGSLHVVNACQGALPLIGCLFQPREQLRASDGVLLPVAAVLVPRHRHNLKALRHGLVLVVPCAVPRPDVLVCLVEELLELRRCQRTQLDKGVEFLLVVVPIFRCRHLGVARARDVARQFVLARLARLALLVHGDESLAGAVEDAARRRGHLLAGGPVDHLLDAQGQPQARAGPASKLVEIDETVAVFVEVMPGFFGDLRHVPGLRAVAREACEPVDDVQRGGELLPRELAGAVGVGPIKEDLQAHLLGLHAGRLAALVVVFVQRVRLRHEVPRVALPAAGALATDGPVAAAAGAREHGRRGGRAVRRAQALGVVHPGSGAHRAAPAACVEWLAAARCPRLHPAATPELAQAGLGHEAGSRALLRRGAGAGVERRLEVLHDYAGLLFVLLGIAVAHVAYGPSGEARCGRARRRAGGRLLRAPCEP
mmetsp:Transcript_55390/g.177714  ORF Transcript_55390/g.177714 Transcript_55390/m.177714 type:complete len:440 (+) Transcript_55390:486-1805(+)